MVDACFDFGISAIWKECAVASKSYSKMTLSSLNSQYLMGSDSESEREKRTSRN